MDKNLQQAQAVARDVILKMTVDKKAACLCYLAAVDLRLLVLLV
jgi:hypothetical protein